MAMILITDNPQGGACRCEGQAQALDLASLSPEQVEALKQALGVNTATGSGEQGTQSLDLSNLSPEQIEQTKQLLGIDDERLDMIIEENVNSFDYTASSDACQVLVFDEAMQLFEHKLRADTQSSSPTIRGTLYDLSNLICELRKNTYSADKRYTNDLDGITRGVLETQIVMGQGFQDYDALFENMLSVNIDGNSGVSSSGTLSEFIEVLARNLNMLISRVNRLEVGQ